MGQKADEKQFNIGTNHRLNRPLLAHPKGCEMKIYIQITPEKIRAKKIAGLGMTDWVEEFPWIAFESENKKNIKAYGEEALAFSKGNTNIITASNPFQDMKTWADDESLVIKYLVWFFSKRIAKNLILRPTVILQPMGYGETLNAVEKRIITETFTFAGARKVYLIETTDELSDGRV